MIKKFNEFDKTNESIVDNITDFFSKKKKEKPVRTSYPPSPEPSGGYEPKMSEKFPCVYSFLTQELADRLKEKGGPIDIRNHGYAMLCETPEELEESKEKYKVGNKYNGETISDFDIGPEQHY